MAELHPSGFETADCESYPRHLYEAVHGGLPGDVHFYRCVMAGASSVLELGSGHGRVAKALAADGLEVTGIDISADSVAIAQRAVPSAKFVVDDMRTFELNQSFDRVICPFNGVYCLLSDEDVIAMFRQVKKHLKPGGLFVFDGYSADAFHATAFHDDAFHDDAFHDDAFHDDAFHDDAFHDDAFHATAGVSEEASPPEFVKQVEVDGTSWRVFESSTWEPREQRIDAFYLHVPTDGRPPVKAKIPQHYLLSTQVEGLLRKADLDLLVLHGDFDQAAWDDESPHLIVTATH